MSPDFFECAEDERFLPLIEAEAHEILPGLWLGGEANAMDVVWLKVHSISRILSINSYAISPLETSCDMSESLKSWFTLNVEHEYIEALDSPTQLVISELRRAVAFIGGALDSKKGVVVHCGRGISRSATLVIAALMHRQKLAYSDAFALVSSKRACIYPNVGFQLQLCLLEKHAADFDACEKASKKFDVACEISISIERTLDNVTEQMDAMFDDEAVCRDAQRWVDYGYFFQNCREYLGHVDIGLPLALLTKAEDVARRLCNLAMVFEGEGVDTAARVGRVLEVWRSLQYRMATAFDAPSRLDPAYVSVVVRDDDKAPAALLETVGDTRADGPPTTGKRDADARDSDCAKRRRAS